MYELDRRQWLTAFGLAIGGLGASRLVAAGNQPVAHPVRLALNENPFGPAPGVIDALRREFANLSRYTGTEYDALVALIAAHEKVPAEQVILGEILEPLGTHLSQTGGPGGEFIYSDPGYTALIDTAVAVGGKAVGVPLNARLENDLPAIAAKMNERTRAVFLVNPHNPTGIVVDADQLRNFARTTSHQALVIVDEAYLEFADRFAERSLADLVRSGENVIVFRTFAKVYGLAGLEIGYGLVPKPLAKMLRAQGLDNPHLFNRLAVVAAIASLQDAGYVARVTREVAKEREKWFEFLRELKLEFTPSTGNFVFFDTGMPNQEFAAALSGEGVVIGRKFPPFERWARISIGLPEENAAARAAVRKSLAGKKG
jgi:histidinol-phosphate aminotransferase